MCNQKMVCLRERESANLIIDYFARKRKRKRENSLKKSVMSSCYVSYIMLTVRTRRRIIPSKHRILWHWVL